MFLLWQLDVSQPRCRQGLDMARLLLPCCHAVLLLLLSTPCCCCPPPAADRPLLPPHCLHADVAGGTGDVAFRVLNAMGSGQYAASSSGSWAAGGSSGSAASAAQPGAAQPAAGGEAAAPPLPAVTVCDINAAMLAEGRKKAEGRGIGPESMQWVEGNAEALPFESDSFDSYTIAFGIRNVTDRAAALREAHR